MARSALPDLGQLRQGFQRFSRGFTPGQKAVTVVAFIAVIVGGMYVMSMTGKPTYVPLFTNLQGSDAASITSKLTADKVAYRLSNGGTTVLVPAASVDKERLALAQSGLPAGGTVGLSLLDKEGITASNMTQQADYLQAIQGELEKTIDSIQGVASSQVNVALPANQDFALNNNNPTGASVMVTMQPGQTLSTSNVEAIVHLVGSSVPNLDVKNVTVADSSGDLLAGPGMAASGGAANGQTASYDGSVQAKVEQYLAAVLGPNNADVQVNATLNYNEVQTNTQSILPTAKGTNASFCTQTSQSTSTYTGTGAPAGGTVGTVTTTGGTAGNGSYNQSQNTQTCETNQQTQTVQQAPGTVTSQSVAVLVNSAALPKGVSMSALQAGVAAAAGITPARGDTLAFSSMPFNTAAAQQAAKAAAATAAATKKQATSSLMRTAAVMLIIGLVLLMVWRSARKAKKLAPTSILSPSDLAALQALQIGDDATTQLPALGVSELAAPPAPAAISAFVDGQPDEVAQLLRGWLDENREVPAQ
ncbi:flagellar M-ring protein FliF [Acidiferrimicrobium sp. IK]|uniref:flagellar basal-body MS-ring/collar protein FliF n=1 Tax=Acidiferrimicrobium sp. IK TaxID=2871700 RepID=UPI0021CB29D8|nr:flagellar basal-body MS-ring/collar protein FliF [Acidiferrimicrobium sp. IK]MCU4185028.1 flagellar M-ring protein FliF [Acidiferrimicrobium sp. IK]